MIPKIIHRVIPQKTTPLMDTCWNSVIENTPGWEHNTHYDSGNYEYVGEYLEMCKHGAFKADLIRLELIYKYGGVYLDSDIKLFKNIDSLLNTNIFLSLENDFYIVNSIIAAEPKNEHILNMLNISIDLLKSGLQPFGVNATHNYCLNRSDITKLPSQNFIMYYGDEKFMTEKSNFYIDKDDVYGQHVYAGSWMNE